MTPPPTDRARARVQAWKLERFGCASDCRGDHTIDGADFDAIAQLLRDTEAEVRAECDNMHVEYLECQRERDAALDAVITTRRALDRLLHAIGKRTIRPASGEPYPFIEVCHTYECAATKMGSSRGHKHGPCDCGGQALREEQLDAVTYARFVLDDAAAIREAKP